MTGRKLLIASAIGAAVVTTACSDVTAPKQLVREVNLLSSVGSATASANASRQCPAPGTGLPGALNMLHDPTMFTIPMVRDAPQGNAGMFRAVAVSAC
jgi:hypothetical protein